MVAQQMDPAQDRLLKLAAAYRQVNLDRGAPPRRGAEIEPLLKERGEGQEIFTSPRDGEPFVIAWGTEMMQFPIVADTPTILAYETSGKDGKRFVLMTAGNVELLDDAEFMEGRFPKGYEPSQK